MANRTLLCFVFASLCAWACAAAPSTDFQPVTTTKDDNNAPVDLAFSHPAAPSPDLAHAPLLGPGPSDGGIMPSSDGSMSSGGGPCGPITLDGICDGNILKWCDSVSNMVETLDCTILGGCTVDSTGFADCVS